MKLTESGIQSHAITLFLCFHREKGHCTCELTIPEDSKYPKILKECSKVRNFNFMLALNEGSNLSAPAWKEEKNC